MEKQIALLKKQIKKLQNQLLQRTRNYLTHFRRLPSKRSNNCKDQQVQTQQPHNVQIQGLNELVSQNNYIISSFQQNEDLHLKQDIQNVLRNLEAKQKSILEENKIQIQTDKYQMIIENNQPIKFQYEQKGQRENIDKKENKQDTNILQLKTEVGILKNQIQSLRQSLQYQIKLSNQTKQSLLHSQFQNHQFRLKIQELNQQIKRFSGVNKESNTNIKQENYINILQTQDQSSYVSRQNYSQASFLTQQQCRSQKKKYQQHIAMLEGVKKGFLKKSVLSRHRILKLKAENQRLAKQIGELRLKLQQKQRAEAIHKQMLHQQCKKSYQQIFKQIIEDRMLNKLYL